jgi:hypothetical protein
VTDPDAVLNRIDDLLDGVDDDFEVSGDAMRWQAPECEGETIEVEGGAKITYLADGYMILDEHLYVQATGQLYPHPPPSPPRRAFQFYATNSTDGPASDSIPAILSPGEAMLPGPDGPIHIRGAYGDQPMEVAQVDLDDIEGDDQ